MPQISVIVPVYKVEPYLRRCVDSILGQTFTDFELILVDDGSPDNCPAICDEYAQKDNRIHVIHQKNGGLSAARNAGIDWAFANSDSQWLTFVDSDDWIHPMMLEALYTATQNLNVSVSVCGYTETSGDEPTIQPNDCRAELCTAEDFYSHKFTNAIIACGKLYQKDCFSELRYPIGKIHEDEFTTYKILFSADRIAVIQSPLYFYYQNAAGIMKSQWSPKRLDSIQAAEEQIQFFFGNHYLSVYKVAVSRCLWFIADNYNHAKHSTNTGIDTLRYLRRKMRMAILKHGSRCRLAIRNYSWAYEVAFPRFMYCYWALNAVKYKLIKRK